MVNCPEVESHDRSLFFLVCCASSVRNSFLLARFLREEDHKSPSHLA